MSISKMCGYGALTEPEIARERVLKAVPDARFERGGVWTGRSVDMNAFLLSGDDWWNEEGPAWISAVNSDRVKQFYKEA